MKMGYLLASLLVISGHFDLINTLDAVSSQGFSGPSFHKENIALNRSTTQSSIWRDYPSKLAVDGNTNKNFTAGSCTHTANDSQSSWSVLLDPHQEYNISNVTLYLRDMIASRYKDLRVTVDGVFCGQGNITNTNDTRYAAAPTPNPVLLRCHQPLRGHNVTIHVNNDYLSLCEVQIWVCQDGWFGNDCSESCRCNDTSEVCDKLTGYCRSGCRSGWEGRGCQIDCTSGPGCSLTCGHCLNSSPCDPVTGLCSGCDSERETGRCDRSPTAEEYVVPYLVWAIVVTVLNLILILAVILLILYIRRRHHQNTSNNQDAAADVDMIDTTHCNQYEDLQTRGQDNPYQELDLQNKFGIDSMANE